MAELIQLRRGDAAEWAAANPVLAAGEPGVEVDTGKQKIGDGSTAWNDLPYVGGGSAAEVEFTPTGNIAATDVQAALAELDTEKAPAGHTHTATEVGAETPTGAQTKADAAEANANAYTDAAVANIGGGGGSASSSLIVLDGIVPLEPVGMDGNSETWLYTDPAANAATTDHGQLAGLTDDDHPLYIKGQEGRSYRTFGGVLRKDAGSWFLLNDSSHRPLGLGAITVTSTYVEVAITLGATVATGLSVTPDETYAQNWTCGVSGGAQKLQIKFYNNGVLQNPQTMPDEPFGNFWIIGMAEV